MDLLYYNDLNYSKVNKQFARVAEYLSQANFSAAEVKKMPETGLYRAKLDYENRLLFKIVKHEDKKYILLLEVIYNHEYSKSRFLRGVAIDESKLITVSSPATIIESELEPLSYINPTFNKVHLLDKVISFDELQQEIFKLHPPVIIIGSAGSGKTALTLEKLKTLTGNILYVTLSPFLIENSYNLYYANNYENEKQEIDFLSYNDFCSTLKIIKGREMDQRAFEQWMQTRMQTFGVKDVHKLFEEFRGVLTGLEVDKPYLSRNEYLGLGVKRSIFLGSERDKVYSVFEKYLDFFSENGFFDLNILSYEYLKLCEPKYDFIVVDEVQDFTNIQLFLVLKSLKGKGSFVLCGDSNQIVHPNFFSWTNIKTMFYKQDMAGHDIKILRANYRNSPEITMLANRLLKVKNARFGSIDKESTYLIEAVGTKSGEVALLNDSEKVRRMLNEKTSRSAKFAVIVMKKEDKVLARKIFKTPLLFSIHEAKGLEYENVIMLNFISGNEKEFNEIIQPINESDLDNEEIVFSRLRDKTDKSIDAYKFYINSFYVAITRSIKNLYLVEATHKHRLLHLLQLVESKNDLKISGNISTAEDWKKEADKLEKQGKKEHADEIRKIFFAQQTPDWEPITNANIDELKKDALDAGQFNKKAKDKLFAYALIYNDFNSIVILAELKYRRAEDPENESKALFRKYYAEIKNDNIKELEQKIRKYGINYRDQFNLTPLLAAIQVGSVKSTQFLLKNGADATLMDNGGRNALRTAINQKFQKIGNEETVNLIFSTMAIDSIRLNINEKLLVLPNKKFEYFLVNFFIALQKALCGKSKSRYWTPCGITATLLEKAIATYPINIIPEFRKKRSYVSSILSKNELFGSSAYNSKLFFRISHGEYMLNSGIEMMVNDKWVNVYDIIGMEKPEILTEDQKIKRFMENIEIERNAFLEREKNLKSQLAKNTGGYGRITRGKPIIKPELIQPARFVKPEPIKKDSKDDPSQMELPLFD
jgi:hypothetical protein